MAFNPKNNHERILHRLKIAKGHLDKVFQMAENSDYCVDILHQSNAVQRALKEADLLLLKNHLETCVSDAIKNGKDKEAIEEIIAVLDKGNS